MSSTTLRTDTTPRAVAGLSGRPYCVWASIDSMSALGLARLHFGQPETNRARTPGRGGGP